MAENGQKYHPLHDDLQQITERSPEQPSSVWGTLGMLANMVRSVTGRSRWSDSPPTNLTEAKAHHDATGNVHNLTRAQLDVPSTSELSSHTANQQNPHRVTAQQANAAPASHVGTAGTAAHPLVETNGQSGFMAGTDKAKLNGLNSADYAPSSHVGSGGSAHAAAVAGGASGFMTGADKAKLDEGDFGGSATPERVFNIEEYGAVGDGVTDCTPAFQQILDEIVALRTGGTLYIPPGEFRTGYVQPTGYDATTPAGLVNISVRGEGQGVSNVLIDNPTGFLRLDTSNRNSQFMFYDFTVVAVRANAGKALQVYVPEGGNQHKRGFLAQNVEIRGGQIDRDYFDYGLKSRGLWRPLFQNFVVAGPYGPNVGRYDPNDYVFSPTCCVDVEGAYAPTLWNTYLWSAKTLFSHTAAEIPGPEGGSINRCFFVEGLEGLKLESLSDEPYFAVTHSHVNCMHSGVNVKSKRFIMIESVLFYSVNYQGSGVTPQPYADIRLNDASEVMVKDSYFHIQGNATRDNVRIESDVFDVSIDGNNFNSVDSMPVRFAGSNISGVVARNNDVDRAIPAITNDHNLLKGEGRLLWSPVSGMVSWTNMPAAETEFLGSTAYRFRLDLSVYTAISLRITMDGSAQGAANASLTLQARNAGGAWVDVISTLIGAGGPRGNNFASIPPGIRQAGQTDCRIVGRGGDGAAAPRMTFVGVMAR